MLCKQIAKKKKNLIKKMAEDMNSYFSKEENQWPTGT